MSIRLQAAAWEQIRWLSRRYTELIFANPADKIRGSSDPESDPVIFNCTGLGGQLSLPIAPNPVTVIAQSQSCS